MAKDVNGHNYVTFRDGRFPDPLDLLDILKEMRDLKDYDDWAQERYIDGLDSTKERYKAELLYFAISEEERIRKLSITKKKGV